MTATDDPTWDFRNPACKPRLLAVLRREANALLAIAMDPDCWHAPTACTGWEVRDMIGHLLADHETVIRALRADLETVAAKHGDIGTNDFLTGLMERHEKMAWMLRAFLEGK